MGYIYALLNYGKCSKAETKRGSRDFIPVAPLAVGGRTWEKNLNK